MGADYLLSTYWKRKACSHRRAAETLRAKGKRTGEARWLKQAATNERTAIECEAKAAHYRKLADE